MGEEEEEAQKDMLRSWQEKRWPWGVEGSAESGELSWKAAVLPKGTCIPGKGLAC